MAFPPDRRAAAHSTAVPVNASSATMTLRLSARSARMPPRGDSRIVGMVAADRIPANTAAEPVTSSTYMDRANLKI